MILPRFIEEENIPTEVATDEVYLYCLSLVLVHYPVPDGNQ